MIERVSRFGDKNGRISLFGTIFFAVRRSQGELRPWRQQSSPHEVQVGQGKDGKRPRRVLGQTAVTNLGEAPQSLHDVKGVFAAGATARSCPIDRPLVLGQR